MFCNRCNFVVQGLLQRTWCVLRPGAPLLRSGFTLYTECNQLQVGGLDGHQSWVHRRCSMHMHTHMHMHMLGCQFNTSHAALTPILLCSCQMISTTVQLVSRAVEWLLGAGQNKSGGGGGNVLCYGYRKKRPTGKPLWPAHLMPPHGICSSRLLQLLC